MPQIPLTKEAKRLDDEIRSLETTIREKQKMVRTREKKWDEAMKASIPRPIYKALEDAGLEKHLRIALNWYRNQDQPAGAWISHFGISRWVGPLKVNLGSGDNRLTFSWPQCFSKVRIGSNLFVFAEEEVDYLLLQVGAIVEVTEHWNGPGVDSVSIRFAGHPGAGARALRDNYKAFKNPSVKAILPAGWS